MRVRVFALLLLGLASATPTYSQPVFIPLGDLPGGEFHSVARAVSGDGSVVVGEGWTGPGITEAFRWTQSGGIVGLGSLSVGSSSRAFGVSRDGSVVVGHDQHFGNSGAVRWTQATGMDELLSLSFARSISYDGSVIVGDGFMAVSGDGSVTVGGPPGFRCVDGVDCFVLADDSLLNSRTQANAVSADGSVIVGYTTGISSGGREQAFVWTAVAGLMLLDSNHPPTGYSIASGISGDGSVVVGQRDYFVEQPNTSSIEAFIWTPTGGLRGLREVLVNDYGLELTGWTLDDAFAVSADGRAIVGQGFNPDGNVEAWLFLIPRCSDGIDDDGDGLIDFDGGASVNHGVPLGPADPGCRDGSPAAIENPKCQDGLDNDGDGKTDFDGGASVNAGIPLGPPDSQCSTPSGKREAVACGLGAEMALLPVLSVAMRRRGGSRGIA